MIGEKGRAVETEAGRLHGRSRRVPRRARAALLAFLAVLLGAGLPLAQNGDPAERAEAFEVAPGDLHQLVAGKEADGIALDFVLRNPHLEALVSGNLPGRKANMTTNYPTVTPGCLYDLCVRGTRNDQLTCLAPGGLAGRVSAVRVGSQGAGASHASVVVERTAALGGGLEESHEYQLAPSSRHLLIVSSYENHRRTPMEVKPEAVWKGLSGELTLRKVRVGDAMDPQDRQAYAVGALPEGSEDAPFTLKPGERRSVQVAVAAGGSPAEAFGIIASLRGATGSVMGRVSGREGAGIPTAAIEIPLDGKLLRAYPDDEGRFEVRLPPGDYSLTARDIGRPAVAESVRVTPGGRETVEFLMAPEARVLFEVAGPDGENLPVKAQFIPLDDDAPDPDLGPPIRARGCRNQYHSETGWFTAAVPPGTYRVIVTRGPEFDHHQADITVRPSTEARVAARLRRVVDTRGWISTDFHSHSTPSGDNYCGTDDRIINLAAEGVEFAPTTEHNRFYDWAPHIARLGLQDELATAVGIELTGRGAHLNAFPFTVEPGRQDGGAPAWSPDPRINALALRDWPGAPPTPPLLPPASGGPERPERWVQINHPTVGEFFRDRDGDGVPDGGFEGLERLLDAAEVWSAEILNPQPILTTVDLATGNTRRFQNRTFAWLQLLNQGRRMSCVAVSDAHGVFTSGAGGWRTYVPSSTDSPARIDPREVIRNARAGRMVVSNGPFLEASLLDGTLPGGTTVAAGSVRLKVRVQTNTWIDVDRVQVLVNGRARRELNFTRDARPDLFPRIPGQGTRFEQVIEVPLSEDSWLIAVAQGERSDLRLGFGSAWQGAMKPCAYHNPIFVDSNGDGFRPNGDTLDHPLPVAFPLRKRL